MLPCAGGQGINRPSRAGAAMRFRCIRLAAALAALLPLALLRGHTPGEPHCTQIQFKEACKKIVARFDAGLKGGAGTRCIC